MNMPSEDIKDILVTEAIGLTFADNLFIGREPSTPDNVVTIFDTPGGAPMLTSDSLNEYYYPVIQIRVRDNKYQDAWAMIDTIKNTLHSIGFRTVNGAVYTVIKCTIEPALLDWDETNRARFVSTFELQRRPA